LPSRVVLACVILGCFKKFLDDLYYEPLPWFMMNIIPLWKNNSIWSLFYEIKTPWLLIYNTFARGNLLMLSLWTTYVHIIFLSCILIFLLVSAYLSIQHFYMHNLPIFCHITWIIFPDQHTYKFWSYIVSIWYIIWKG